METLPHRSQAEQTESAADGDSKPLDTWIGDELLGVLNAYLDKSRNDVSKSTSPREVVDSIEGNPTDINDSAYYSAETNQITAKDPLPERAPWPTPTSLSPPKSSAVDTSESPENNETSVEGTLLLPPPTMNSSKTQRQWAPTVNYREPSRIDIDASVENGTLFEDT